MGQEGAPSAVVRVPLAWLTTCDLGAAQGVRAALAALSAAASKAFLQRSSRTYIGQRGGEEGWGGDGEEDEGEGEGSDTSEDYGQGEDQLRGGHCCCRCSLFGAMARNARWSAWRPIDHALPPCHTSRAQTRWSWPQRPPRRWTGARTRGAARQQPLRGTVHGRACSSRGRGWGRGRAAMSWPTSRPWSARRLRLRRGAWAAAAAAAAGGRRGWRGSWRGEGLLRGGRALTRL